VRHYLHDRVHTKADIFFRYWDQASVLVQVSASSGNVIRCWISWQLGLLDPSNLPVAGVDVARKVVYPFDLPSNTVMAKWKESEGKDNE
jgi:hypothetical protein